MQAQPAHLPVPLPPLPRLVPASHAAPQVQLSPAVLPSTAVLRISPALSATKNNETKLTQTQLTAATGRLNLHLSVEQFYQPGTCCPAWVSCVYTVSVASTPPPISSACLISLSPSSPTHTSSSQSVTFR